MGTNISRREIKTRLADVVSDWIGSIEDGQLCTGLRVNTIVTGGAIVSMLLNEPVNDYDIYITDRKVALKVVQYYLKKFQRRNPSVHGGNPIQSYDNGSRIQVDLYGESLRSQEDHIKPSAHTPIFISDTAITLNSGIQIIYRLTGTPEEIHKDFDFEHTKCYYQLVDRTLHLPAAALESILTKSLVYCGGTFPINSMLRVPKFIQRGWSISKAQLLKIIWQISELDLTSMDIMGNELSGVSSEDTGSLRKMVEGLPPEMRTADEIGRILEEYFGEL